MNFDENEYMLRARRGDKTAYEYLVRKYMKPAYYSALAIVGSHDDALDVSQQAFIQAYKAITRFESGKKFFTWYYKILRNLCLNCLRDKAHHAKPFSSFADYIEFVEDNEDPSTLMEREELRESVRRALDQLKPEEREIIVMREFEDKSYAEMSEILECPLGTVMSRLYYVRRHLKELLEDLI